MYTASSDYFGLGLVGVMGQLMVAHRFWNNQSQIKELNKLLTPKDKI